MSWDDDEFTKKRKEWEAKQQKLALERKKQDEEDRLKKEQRKLEEKRKAERKAKQEERQSKANEEMEKLMGEAFAGGKSAEEQKVSATLGMGAVFGGGSGLGGGGRRFSRGAGSVKPPPGAVVPGLDDKTKEEREKNVKYMRMTERAKGGGRFSGGVSGGAGGSEGGGGSTSRLKRF
jgi:hypothetical protein